MFLLWAVSFAMMLAAFEFFFACFFRSGYELFTSTITHLRLCVLGLNVDRLVHYP